MNNIKINTQIDMGGMISFRTVSLFENFYQTIPCGSVDMLDWLCSDKYKDTVIKYRLNSDPEERKKIKQSLPCITPFGKFSRRNIDCIESYSKCVYIDADGKDNTDTNWEHMKKKLELMFPELLYAGLSISGCGLCLIFKIPEQINYNIMLDSIALDLRYKANLVIDTQVRDIVRLHVASYDPDPYVNISASESISDTYLGMILQSIFKRKSSDIPSDTKTALQEKIRRLVDVIEDNRLDITSTYKEWFCLGAALSSEFDHEEGLNLFRRISRYYPSYDDKECVAQFMKCANMSKINGATFLYICKRHGVKLDGYHQKLDHYCQRPLFPSGVK